MAIFMISKEVMKLPGRSLYGVRTIELERLSRFVWSADFQHGVNRAKDNPRGRVGKITSCACLQSRVPVSLCMRSCTRGLAILWSPQHYESSRAFLTIGVSN